MRHRTFMAYFPQRLSHACSKRPLFHGPAFNLTTFKQAFGNLFREENPRLYQESDATIFRAAYDYCDQNQLKTAGLLVLRRNIVRDRLIRYGMIHSPKVTA